MELSVAFSALANDDRLRTMDVLRQRAGGRMSISELAWAVGVSRFAMSRHLRILREARLVRAERCQQRVLHSICLSSVAAIEDWVIAFPVDPVSSTETRPTVTTLT